MVVRNWMNESPLTAGAVTSVRRACEIVTQHAVHVLPIVDPDRRFLGVVTDRSLLEVAARREPGFDSRLLLTLLTQNARTVGPDAALEVAVRHFCEDPHLDALPVVEHGKLRGLLPRSAAMRALALRAGAACAAPLSRTTTTDRSRSRRPQAFTEERRVPGAPGVAAEPRPAGAETQPPPDSSLFVG